MKMIMKKKIKKTKKIIIYLGKKEIMRLSNLQIQISHYLFMISKKMNVTFLKFIYHKFFNLNKIFFKKVKNLSKLTFNLQNIKITWDKDQDQDLKCLNCNKFSIFKNKCENCENIICDICLENNIINNCKICKCKLILNNNCDIQLENFNNSKVNCLCSDKDCKLKFKYENISDCIILCDKVKLNKCNGCKDLFSYKDIDNHILMCEKLLFECKFCEEKFNRNKILKHYINCLNEINKKEKYELNLKYSNEIENNKKINSKLAENENLCLNMKDKIKNQNYNLENFQDFLFYFYIVVCICIFLILLKLLNWSTKIISEISTNLLFS